MKNLIILALALVAFASCEKTELISSKSGDIPDFNYEVHYQEAYIFDYDAYGTSGDSWINFTNDRVIITLDVRSPKSYYADYDLQVEITLYDEETKTIRAKVSGDVTGEIIFIEGESFKLIADNPTGEPAHFVMY